MYRTWVVSQKDIPKISNLDTIVKGENFVFYAQKQNVMQFESNNQQYFVLIDG